MIEYDDRWFLASQGREIARICLDWAVTLTVGTDDAGFDIRICTPFVLTAPGGAETVLVPAGPPAGLAPVLRLLRLRVARADAFKDGRLELELSDRGRLRVAAAGEFESWEIVARQGARLLSASGGGLAVWTAGSPA